MDFIEKGQNVILTGNPGTGKTHVAIGLGIKACEQGYRVLFTTIPLLVTELKRWGEVFGDPAMTSAMIDRLTYKAIIVDMEGDSYRLRETLRLNGASLESVKM